MTYFLAALVRNLAAGARLALPVPVGKTAFRFDLWQWVAIVVVSALVDVVLDALRAKPGTAFTLAGVDGELYALGLLMLTSGLLGALFRDAELFVSLPIVILASFLPVQIVHALPAIVHLAWPPGGGAIFDIVMLAWMLAVCVRAVYVASESPAGGRFWRALVGGVLLSLPLWVGPLGGPFEGWWTTPEEEQDAESPSPASEPVLAVQSTLLDDALDAIEDERGGVTDLYFVGFAPDARHEGFRDEIEKAQHVLDERFDTRGRSLLLLNNRSTVTELPYATLTNLRRALQEIGGAINADEDVVMVYLTGGTTDDHALAAVHPPLDLVDITPAAVRQLLDSAGIRYRVVVVSACAAGAWAETFQDDDTAVLVAAPGEAEPAGCEGGDAPSALAEALFDRALRTTDSLPAALTAAAHDVGDQSTTLWIGPRIATQLERLRHGSVRTAALR